VNFLHFLVITKYFQNCVSEPINKYINKNITIAGRVGGGWGGGAEPSEAIGSALHLSIASTKRLAASKEQCLLQLAMDYH